MGGDTWLKEIIDQYEHHKSICEQAAAQLSDEEFFEPLGATHHSVGELMKHLGGNNLSRWRDFLTTDGEKGDRNREMEFTTVGETRESVMSRWEEGWRTAFAEIGKLTVEDLDRLITIRGEPLPVRRAILRNLSHAVYHSGQIVLIARFIRGDSWEFQSIPPGESEEHNKTMREKYGDWNG